ncbi:Uncharacterised protein [Enterobacter hormaechei]|nr:Uncharacterised protein [Enterobacter hormaechei]VAE14215.1 Uncharacterised protein [Enterobacter hormaechei]VAF10565.1 Uncharacterised protein [Enterobacter hormaechei]
MMIIPVLMFIRIGSLMKVQFYMLFTRMEISNPHIL